MPETIQFKVPMDAHLEKEILGCCFQENRGPLTEVRSVMAEDDFGLANNRRIFRALCAIADRGDPLTTTGVYAQLQALATPVDLGELTDCFCPELDFALPSNLARAKELANRRRVVLIASNLALTAGDAGSSFSECVESTRDQLRTLGCDDTKEADDSIDGIITAAGGINEFFRARRGIQTAWPTVNEVTAGWNRGELVIVAARPSMGKTAFALNAFHHAASKKIPSVFYSFEMTRDALVKRLISYLTGITFMDLQRGELTLAERHASMEASLCLSELPLRIHSAAGKTVLAIRNHIERMKRKGLCEFALLDYIGLVRGNDRGDNRNRELGDICRQLKTTAMELDIPFVVLAQLNRAVEGRTDKRPIMSDLRDSGELEEHADGIFFLHRPEYYSREDASVRGIAELIIAKQRNGPTPIVQLRFEYHRGRFSDENGS